MGLERTALLERTDLNGSAFAEQYSAQLDEWIRSIAVQEPIPDGVALVAVGGYGRKEMAPESDLDIAIVHDPGVDVADFAERVWYPIWDEKLKLGHRVDTLDGLLRMARTDLDTATSLLATRHLAGDERLALDLAVAAGEQWRNDAAEHAVQLAERRAVIHEQHGDVAFELGPDLKNGRGGLRDVHALEWARATGVLVDAGDEQVLEGAREVLLRARTALHRTTGRANDRLVLDYQDEVAEQLGYRNADALMADVAQAGRSIAWVTDAAWFGVERSFQARRRASDLEVIDGSIVVDGGLLRLSADIDRTDPLLVFEVAKIAASRRCFIERQALVILRSVVETLPVPWTADMRAGFTDTLRLGRAAIPVIEAYDQVGIMSKLLPEWEPCRSRPQRNAYHRFTVDRHLLEAAAEAAELTDRVDRPDLLVLGALLHDIGKGYPGDHTAVGVELIDGIGRNMGFGEQDATLLVDMCRHHLLLPDAATRRDLDDDGTIASVAEAVGSIELLGLLGALTEADSIATGPSAWNASKAELVRKLVDRVGTVLAGAAPSEVVGESFPGPGERELMATGHFEMRLDGTCITVVQSDAPGAFSRVAGVLTLNGLDIVSAAAHTESGRALSQFHVKAVRFDLGRLETQMREGVAGRLALAARVSERRQTYARTLKRSSASHIHPKVVFDNETSDVATVIEVSGRDQIGLLYQISRALSELRVGISTARIQTIGDRVVDAFYVTCDGKKILDETHLAEIERAVLHSISTLYSSD